MRILDWGTMSLRSFRKSERTYRSDVPVRDVAAVEVLDTSDYAYKLDGENMRRELMPGAGGYLSLPDATGSLRGVSPDIW